MQLSQIAVRGLMSCRRAFKSDYRQVFFKPYRVIYQVKSNEVVIHLIADGRRNLQTLLLRRLTED